MYNLGPDISEAPLNSWPMATHALLLVNRSTLVGKAPCRFSSNSATHAGGGALSLHGSKCSFLLLGLDARGNKAATGGGAVFAAARTSALLITDGHLEGNNAGAVGGGAVLAGAVGLGAALVRTRILDNRASGALSAGGGFCCHLCTIALLEGCEFANNSAGVFGGGAALLRVVGEATISGSNFHANTVGALLPSRGGATVSKGTGPARDPRARALLQAPSNGSNGGEAAVGEARLDEEGSDPTDVTISDDMLYPGGGGLYVSALGAVVINTTTMTGNTGANGGGAILRTDLCSQQAGPGASNATHANNTGERPPPGQRGCLFLLGANDFSGNRAALGNGGGLLVTNASLAYTSCGAQGCARAGLIPLAACLQRAVTGAGAPPQSQLRALGLPHGNAAEDSDTANIASTVAELAVTCASASTSALGQGPGCEAGPSDGTPRGVVAPPNSVVQADVAILDWLGSTITSGSDSTLMLQLFTGPGEYELHFTPVGLGHLNVVPALLNLTIRECFTGESNTSARAAGGAGGGGGPLATCERCREGTVSLDPLASGGCVVCEGSMHAMCTGDALIPDDGWWQSHPRSPLVHRCLLADACNHSARAGEMRAWASAHAAMTAGELDYLEYTQLQCATGYEGVLCGECALGFGRHGPRCVRCLPRGINTVLYMVSLGWVGLLIAISAVFHLKQVNEQRGQRASTDSFRSASGTACDGSGGEDGLGQLPPIFGEDLDTVAVSDVGSKGSLGARTHRLQGSGMLDGPAVQGLPPAAAEGSLGSGGAHAGAPPPAGGSFLVDGPPAAPDLWRQKGALSRKFSVEMRPDSIARVQLASRGTSASSGSLGLAPPASSGGLSFAAAGARFRAGGKAGSAPGSLSGPAAGDATGAAPASCGAGGFDVAVNSGPLAAPSLAASAVVQRRFWLSNVFKLLITHMQMLGLLRGIRMNWPAGMDQWFGYIDQSQAVSSWVALECSFPRAVEGALRSSVARMMLLLLLPVLGAVAALAYSCACALYFAARARWSRARGAAPVTWAYYFPRFVMSLVLVCFYTYPQVSDAVVSILVACTPVDDPAAVRPAALPLPGVGPPGASALAALKAVGLYWNMDTRYQCFEGPMRWLMGMGIAWAVLFCLGFPLGVALALWRNKSRLDDTAVDLKYGFFYNSYRLRFYYWESVLLLEKLALALVVTATQRFGAPSQVLAALGAFFVFLLVQSSCHPYGCIMLDTLQATSMFALSGTTFALMMPALDGVMAPSIGADPARSAAVTASALALMGLLNLAAVAAFLGAMALEGRRMFVATLDREGKGHVTWADVRGFAHTSLPGWAAGALAPCLGPPPVGAVARGGGWGAAYVRPTPPVERVPEECEAQGGSDVEEGVEESGGRPANAKRARGKGRD
ncbi:MAG: hypothetical protein J3K34DRAFT_504194 [Monoraphidium minutum]|nr:MAG: hypothetical protein J3K34DRAFT_504194 [Monoraphidium minutum]